MFLGTWNKSEKYYNFKIPLKNVEKGIKEPENINWLLDYVNEQFSREVYLSVEKMKDQLNLLGLNFEDILCTAFVNADTSPEKYGKIIIRELFERRNQIAHQLDRKHSNAHQNDISKEYVEDCMNNVEKLINAIHKAAEEKEMTS